MDDLAKFSEPIEFRIRINGTLMALETVESEEQFNEFSKSLVTIAKNLPVGSEMTVEKLVFIYKGAA